MHRFHSLLISFLFLSTLGTSFGSLGSIAGKPTHEVILSEKAAFALESVLAEKPGRTAGNISPTGSMVPTLDDSVIIIVEKTSFADLKVGQIALYHAFWTENVIAHRIVGRLSRGWRTKGDALREADPSTLTQENFTGYTVVAAIKKSTGELKYIN